MILAAVLAAGLLAHQLFYWLARRLTRRTRTDVDDALIRYSRGPTRLLLPLLLISFVSPTLRYSGAAVTLIRHAASLGLIATVAWLIIRSSHLIEDLAAERYDVHAADNLEARKVLTQMRVLRRVISTVVVILAVASMLMTFERVRQLGTSILASAGIIGIIVGVASQRTIANLVAGVQIALTQPFRIDDVVIIEGEWGRIEEVTLTYVVVRIWDLRRLVVPVSQLIEKPFQNWTRVSANLLGTVYLHVDYAVPVDEVREELHRILKASARWDGETWGLQVTDAGERTIELRALMSAPDASTAWDLRCEVREKLVGFVQRRHPEGLPRLRAALDHAAHRAGRRIEAQSGR